jgi:hypothetical protein
VALERLCRYLSRPAIAQDHLELECSRPAAGLVPGCGRVWYGGSVGRAFLVILAASGCNTLFGLDGLTADETASGAGGCGVDCGGFPNTGGDPATGGEPSAGGSASVGGSPAAGGGGSGGSGGSGGGACASYPPGGQLVVDGEVHCYWLVATAVAQCDAVALCNVENGPLGSGYIATIHSAVENVVVQGVIGNAAPEAWIGARRGGQCPGANVPFQWLTGETGPAGAFEAWAPTEPAETNRGAAMVALDASWVALMSVDNLRPVVCEAGLLAP